MKSVASFAVFAISASTLFAQAPFQADVVGNAVYHVSWPTQIDYNYQVEVSPDLESWVDTGIVEPGTSATITYGFLVEEAERLYYRIRETADPFNGGFLVLPTHDMEVDLIDGVCFAFNLNVFSALPAKIRVYQRVYNSGDPWEQIGLITEFAEIDMIKFVRGSAVWLPDAEGEYEVQAAVVDGTGAVIASAVRRVIVGSNQPPTIEITGGPPTPSEFEEPAEFETDVSDPDLDEIRRVEFFDNGILIGTDREAPFGDDIEDLEGTSYDLFRGAHDITAKAYDSRGAVGETASAFQVEITDGNARPTIDVTSPASGLIVIQGQPFTVSYDEGDPDGAGDINGVRVYDGFSLRASDTSAPFDDLTIATTGWQLGSHVIRVVTEDCSFTRSYPHYFTVFVHADAGNTFAEALVANIVDETTVAPSNQSFTGIQVSSDAFVAGIASGLEFDGGIVITSGAFSSWNTGDEAFNQEETSTELGSPGYEPLEDRIVGFRTRP